MSGLLSKYNIHELATNPLTMATFSIREIGEIKLMVCMLKMKEKCLIKNEEYWNIRLEEGEVPIPKGCNENVLSVRTKEGFVIRITFRYIESFMTYFNGYVSVPSSSALFHLGSWIEEHPSYDDMNYFIDANVELTFFDPTRKEYGWDHAHAFDANLNRPLTSQLNSHKLVTGPVQILEEARSLIASMMTAERRLIREIMEEKRSRTEIIREELMMKSCHPKRIAAWSEQGFEPF